MRFIPFRPLAALCASAALLTLLPAARALQVEELDNGLKIVVEEHHVAPVAAFRIYVRAGGIYEQEFLGKGLTHVLEHLLCAGATSKHTEDQSKQLVQELGGALNAYTTTGHTCYHLNTTADHLDMAIDLLGDWVEGATIQDPQFARELGVVMEELKKGLEEPPRVLQKAFHETMFQVHPVRVPVIGYQELVSKITREDVLTYYHRMYVPNNIVVVAVGDFDEHKVMAHIKAAFGPYQRRPTPAIALPAEPPQVSARERTITREGLGGAYAEIGFHTVPLQHPDLYPLDVLSYILSNGRSSRLVQHLAEQQHLVASIQSFSDTPEYDAGVFGVHFMGPDDKVDAARAAVWQELQRVCDEPVTATELEQAKTQKMAEEIRSKQTAEDVASDLGGNYLFTGNPEYGKVYLAGIAKVTAADIQRVARTYFRPENMTTVLLRPAHTGATATAVKAPPAATQVREVTLPNGLRLLVKRNPGVAVVAVQASFFGGVRLEPAGQNGVSRLAGSLWTRGTAAHSALEFATTFDRMGGSIQGASGNNSLGLSMEVLAADFTKALDLYADALTNPAFPERELATVKARTLDAIARKKDDWESELDEHFRQSFFTQHPYRNDALGTKDSVAAITADQVRAFYQAHVVPSQGVMAVYGDIDEAQVIAAVTAKLGSWQPAGAPAAAPTAPAATQPAATTPAAPVPAPTVKSIALDAAAQILANRLAKLNPPAAAPAPAAPATPAPAAPLATALPPGPAPQPPVAADTTKLFPSDREISAVMIGYPGLRIADEEDSYALSVMQGVLTGVGYQGGRLEDALRGGKNQLVYQVAGINFPGLEPGYFGILAASSPEKMDTVIKIILDHVAKITTTPVSADELAKAKTISVTMDQLSRQTNAATAQQAVLDELYGLGYAHGAVFAAKVKAVTAADVQRVAQKYLTHYVLVRTGPPAGALAPAPRK